MKKITEERIELSQLKNNFGNPRKISKEKMNELKKSIEKFGDF